MTKINWLTRASAVCLAAFLAAFLATACSSEETEDRVDPSDELLTAPPDGEGIQFAMTTTIGAGVEVEHCKLVQVPPEGLLVNHDEVRYTPGSHHFLLFQTTLTEIPADRGNQVFNCSDGAFAQYDVTRLVGGSQSADGNIGVMFPPDVAIRVPGNTVLLMNAHYLNASEQELKPEIRINLWTITEEALRVEGDILFLYNPLIKVGAEQTGRARLRCPVQKDITLVTAQSHMHARGVGYAASILGQEPFYESDQWEDVEVAQFSGGMQIAKGEWLDYQCDYANGENRDIYQGATTQDEMCMLIGAFWPADQATANCVNESGSFAGEWVGNGSATCLETLTCVRQSASINSVTDCVLDADPNLSREVSQAALCAVEAADDGWDCEEIMETCAEM